MLKRYSFSIGLVTMALLFFACSNSVMDGEYSEHGFVPENSGVKGILDSETGMVHVLAKDAYVVLGNSSSGVKLNEQGQLKVFFDYDFSIGEHEVSCAEYREFMPGNNAECKSALEPVSDVTYFDAVLFANAKSRSAGLDTAYTYTSSTMDNAGHCTELEGLLFHADVDAFRLPTEAEWVLVASQGFDASEGWTAENSEFKKHDVCSMPANDIHVCDMVGNVMEWVNDWLGYFKDTSMTDFAGAADGGMSGERVVKGGLSIMNFPR